MTTKTTVTEPEISKGDEVERLALLVMSAEAFVSIPLPRNGTMVIGRSNACEVQLDSPLASRQHARLRVGLEVEIEDLGSSNGTRVRDVLIAPHAPVRLALGETVTIGSTMLVLQPVRYTGRSHRIWSHPWFEDRLRDECTRCAEVDGRFALVRLRLDQPVSWYRVVPLVDRELPSPHIFAAYGPSDYQLLLLGADASDAAAVVGRLRTHLETAFVSSRAGIACFPRDGRTPDALMARANDRLRPTEPASPALRCLSAAPTGAMQQVTDQARLAAKSNINVLILGETGVGKEVMAQSLHQLSLRAAAPLLALNCAGLSENLVESELFGHERGAFTGAVNAKRGLFEAAVGGTLFLDEVGEMSLSVQAKVLRAIASREIMPVGAVKTRPIDVRIVAATNRDLEKEIEKGAFRRDLYYRLNGIALYVPPLRERCEEIPRLTEAFLLEAARNAGREPPSVSDAAMELLVEYHWPGNIRELRNVVERALVLCEGDIIDLPHLPVEKLRAQSIPQSKSGQVTPVDPRLSPDEVAERQRMVAALEANAWNQSRAARMLRIPRRTFVSKLERYGIPRPQKDAYPPGLGRRI